VAITNGYLTLVEFKSYKGGTGVFDTNAADDNLIEQLIEGASRFIDNGAGRSFYSDTGETRYYTAKFPDMLFIDDLYGITTLKTDEDGDGTYENTWNTGQSTGDFWLMPLNATLNNQSYSWLEVNPEGDYTFPTNKKGVQIKGDWGLSAVPDIIKMACYEIVNAAYGRKSGQNLTGNAEVTAAGIVITPDDITPFARSVIDAYRRGYSWE
jgi:hypothetical protein